jgi:hypothetical protein
MPTHPRIASVLRRVCQQQDGARTRFDNCVQGRHHTPHAFAPEFLAPLRRLVAEVRIYPSEGFAPFAIEIKGHVNALMAEALVPFGKVAMDLVAEEGLEPPTRGL